MKIYLAGPDVFRNDASNYGKWMVSKCNKYNFEAYFPMDLDTTCAQSIYQFNLKLINDCDCIIANLNNFRGSEPDSGTVFEIGYAKSLNKLIIGYCKNHKKNYSEFINYIDNEYPIIENFNNRHNLMITCSLYKLVETFEDALSYLNFHFK